MKKLLLFLLVALLFGACQKDELPTGQFQFVKPSHFPEPTYTFDINPVTKEGFELGKRIFGDPMLSRDNSVACNNCHVKAVAFADPQHALSLGVDERQGIRNAPGIANMAFMKEFMWDGGVYHLDFAPPNAIENPLEMDEKMANVVGKLNRNSTYPAQFRAAFPEMGDTITSPYVLLALSQYQTMLVSATSKYDYYKLGKGELSANEMEGCNSLSKNAPSATAASYSPTRSTATTASTQSLPMKAGRELRSRRPTWASSRCPVCATLNLPILICTTPASTRWKRCLIIMPRA